MNAEMNKSLMNSNATPVPMNMTGPPSPWINPPQNLQIETLTAQQVALNDQIRESETNLSAQHEVNRRQHCCQYFKSSSKNFNALSSIV